MGFFNRIHNKFNDIVVSRVFRPRIEITPVKGLLKLGSSYGGWTIKDDKYLTGCFALSAGLGEDASFDVEFAARYGAEIVVIDPTPRSIAYFQQLMPRIGSGATKAYGSGGYQPFEAYDLSKVRHEQIRLEDKALWVNEEPIRFFRPENVNHVSHSVKFKPKGGEEQFILVPTVTIASLLSGIPKERFALLKMDIEGAETDVLDSISEWPALPRQILVEFDVLRKPGLESRDEVERCDASLRGHGYVCCHFDGDRNYLYVLNDR